MLSGLDHEVLAFFGTLAGRHALLDNIAVKFLDLYAVKLLLPMAVLVFLWFGGDDRKMARQTVVTAILAMFLAVAVSRTVQDLSPMRLRPLHSGDPAYVAPVGIDTTTLEHWSSFPSDHAALIFALATTLWLLSRRLGAAAYAWAVLIVCLPRLYAGYHYASDAMAGALIGVAASIVVARLVPTRALAERASRLEALYPGPFIAGFFMLMYFFATMFEEVRRAVHAVFA